jgi:hypothetical protein
VKGECQNIPCRALKSCLLANSISLPNFDFIALRVAISSGSFLVHAGISLPTSGSRHDRPSRSAAEDALLGSIASARRRSAPSWELKAAIPFARIWLRQGRRNRVRIKLEEIYGRFTEGFGTLDLLKARERLDESARLPAVPGAKGRGPCVCNVLLPNVVNDVGARPQTTCISPFCRSANVPGSLL